MADSAWPSEQLIVAQRGDLCSLAVLVSGAAPERAAYRPRYLRDARRRRGRGTGNLWRKFGMLRTATASPGWVTDGEHAVDCRTCLYVGRS